MGDTELLHQRVKMEGHLAVATLELVRVRRRLNDATDITSTDRQALNERIDRAFDTMNRFKLVERHQQMMLIVKLVIKLVYAEQFPRAKKDYPSLRLDELQKLVSGMEGDFA